MLRRVVVVDVKVVDHPVEIKSGRCLFAAHVSSRTKGSAAMLPPVLLPPALRLGLRYGRAV
jgi:hypothetical protein